jgi:hypothetical protein
MILCLWFITMQCHRLNIQCVYLIYGSAQVVRCIGEYIMDDVFDYLLSVVFAFQLCRCVYVLFRSVNILYSFFKMENEIRRMISEKGIDLFIVNGHKCRYIRQRADGYVML